MISIRIQISFLFILIFTIACNKEKRILQAESQILIAPFDLLNQTVASKLQIMNDTGLLLREIEIPAAASDFKKWTIGNKIRYTYLQFDPSAYKIPKVGYIPGYVVLLDENLKELKRFNLLPKNDRTINDVNALDGHDFILLDDDHYISMAYFEKHVDNIPVALNPLADVKVVACIIQEVNQNNVIWEWDGTQHQEFYASSVEGNYFNSNAQAWDYMHMNSMAVDPKDNQLVCSFRNLNQVVKINRKTGEILWRLGGANSDFPLSKNQIFLRQHSVHYTKEGSLLIFDNGEVSIRAQTRIVEMQLDEVAKRVSSFKTLELPNNLFCQYMGSVQKTDSSYFIGCGSEPRIMELRPNGAIIFNKRIDNSSYRAFRQ